MKWLAAPLMVMLGVLVGSQLITDRIGWLQFAWWTPRTLLAGASLAGFVLLLALSLAIRTQRVHARWAAKWAIAALAIGLLVSRHEWGLPRDRPTGAVRIAFWNACYADRGEATKSVDFLLSLDADALIVTDPGFAFTEGGAERLRDAGYTIVQPGKFTLLSRGAVTLATPVFAARGRALSEIELVTPEGPVSIDAVDLPSEPTLPRVMTARSFVAAVGTRTRPPADLVVGDFNITRGSASMSIVAPGAVESFASAGTGWGGTYPRERPIVGIDQILVRDPWRALRAEVVDPGFGRHRGIVADITRAPR